MSLGEKMLYGYGAFCAVSMLVMIGLCIVAPKMDGDFE